MKRRTETIVYTVVGLAVILTICGGVLWLGASRGVLY